MIIYGATVSPFVKKVLVAAALKGIAVDLKSSRASGTDFTGASPFGKIPAMRDGDFCLADSSAIVHYFDAQYPEPALIPPDPRARAQVIWFDEFADTVLFEDMRDALTHGVLFPRMYPDRADPALVAPAIARLPRSLDYLESRIPESNRLVADRLTLADVAVAAPFASLILAGVGPVFADHPKVTRWLAEMLAMPQFTKLLESDQAIIAHLDRTASEKAAATQRQVK